MIDTIRQGTITRVFEYMNKSSGKKTKQTREKQSSETILCSNYNIPTGMTGRGTTEVEISRTVMALQTLQSNFPVCIYISSSSKLPLPLVLDRVLNSTKAYLGMCRKHGSQICLKAHQRLLTKLYGSTFKFSAPYTYPNKI